MTMRFMVIGNGGGGKSTLSAALAKAHGVPWHEVDQFQFEPGWVRVPESDLRTKLFAIQAEENWLIDGFGPMDTILQRFDLADKIYFIDHPLWVHYWWAMERQIAAFRGEERLGGPEGCDLRNVNKEMCRAIWIVHTEFRPMLLEAAEKHSAKVEWIRSPDELNATLATLNPPS
jgi:adenylate kinase family enzyme